MPASIPESMTASRSSLLACCVRIVSVVRPSASVSVSVFRASPSGMPSYTSVATIRSFGTISRYSPWKAASNPSSVTITHRHAPPTCRSISATVTSPRFPLHQRLTSSGVVHALYTRCLGASNSRVIRICSSVGSVTVALPLPVTSTPFLLPLEVLEHGVHSVEPLRPEALVAQHPIVDGLERPRVQPVHPPPPLVARLDRPHLAEHPQMFGHQRLGHPQPAHQVAHGPLAGGEEVQDLPPPGLGYRVKRVRRGRRSGHEGIIYNRMVICQGPGWSRRGARYSPECLEGWDSPRRRPRRGSAPAPHAFAPVVMVLPEPLGCDVAAAFSMLCVKFVAQRCVSSALLCIWMFVSQCTRRVFIHPPSGKPYSRKFATRKQPPSNTKDHSFGGCA